MRQEQSPLNSELKLGIVGALIIHSVIFLKIPYVQARFDVMPALSALEVNLIAGGLEKEVPKKVVVEEKAVRVDTPDVKKIEEMPVVKEALLLEEKVHVEQTKIVKTKEPVMKQQTLQEKEQKADQAGAENSKQGALIKARPLTYYNPAPTYPYVALQRGYEGEVTLIIAVNKSGLPDDVGVARSSGYGILDSAAVKAVKKWKFEPAKLFGVSVDSEIEIPVKFELATSRGRVQ
ncbi:MAG: energy transducer TonB [Candidatus Omnitrophica bacterium]|nr:energy transducer TonB [Candidatus Omnitrophota bacterium]